jgi:amino acid adenylation domain-containing protein
MVILQNRLADTRTFAGLPARAFFEPTETAKVDLAFSFKETDADGLLLEIEHAADVFLPERMRHVAGHFQVLLDGILAEPAAPIASISLLSPAERARVVHAFNETAVAYPHDRAVIDLFEAQARRTPEAPAARHRERTCSYRELDDLANRLARHLRARAGLDPGEIVVLCVPSGPELLAALLAVLKLRAAAVLVEPSTPLSRLASLLEESGSRVLVTERRPGGLAFAGVSIELGREHAEIAARGADPVAVGGRDPGDAVLVFFTSGSTGRPKGVPLTNRGIVNELHWFRRYFDLGPADVLPQKTVVAFVDCIVELLLPITLGGGCVDLRPDHDVARDVGALVKWFRAIRPTIVQFVPAVFDEIAAEVDGAAFGALRALVLSGGPAGRRPAYPFRVYNLYGCSECTSLSTAFDMTEPTPLARVPIGTPLQNTRVYVLDAAMEPCPVYVPGELYVGGDMVATGYLGQPALTAERFVPDPFRPGERLFRTGDHARWLPDGTIDYLGRRDDQLKVRGVRIEPGEIEHALREHPAVREAVVTGRPRGGGDALLAAYVVPEAGRPVSAPELRAALAERLPDALIPSALVILDALPRTASGKVDRRALPAPGPAGPSSPTGGAPRDDTEAAIARIWCEVLGIAAASVDDDFFALGGHSLKASRLVARLQRDLGVALALVDVLRHPTIAGLAAAARARGRAAAPGIRPVDEPEALSPATEEELAMLREEGTP